MNSVSNQIIPLRRFQRPISNNSSNYIQKENPKEAPIKRQLTAGTRDLIKKTKDFLDKKTSLQGKLDEILTNQLQTAPKRLEILLPTKLRHLLENQFLLSDPEQQNSQAPSFASAKLKLVSELILTKNTDTSKWLSDLATVADQIRAQSTKYLEVVREMKKRTQRGILLLNQCFFGSLALIMRRCVTNKKAAKSIDIQTFLQLLLFLNHLKCFTCPQKKYLINQYLKYCWLNDLRPNESLLAIMQEKKRTSYPEDLREFINQSDRVRLDVDDSFVDDDTVEIILTDEWYENFESELDAMKEQILCRMDEKKICMEKSFSNNSSNSELTKREACVMCKNERRAVLFMPCTHFLTCEGCANLLDQCLVCKQGIAEGLLVYWS